MAMTDASIEDRDAAALREFAEQIHDSFHVGCPPEVARGCIQFIERKSRRVFPSAARRAPALSDEQVAEMAEEIVDGGYAGANPGSEWKIEAAEEIIHRYLTLESK